MKKVMYFLSKRPFVLWITIFLLYALLSTILYPIHYIFADSASSQLYAEGIIKIIVFGLFLWIVRKLNYMKESGLTKFGGKNIWLITIAVFLYLLPTKLYAFTGQWYLDLPSMKVLFSNLVYYLSGSLVEEIMYRGIILTAMIMAWGREGKGLIKAIIFSSILFGLSHLLNLISAPVFEVLLQIIVVIIPGIFYAVCLRYSKSLWPPIIIHWLTNSIVNIQLANMGTYEITLYNWLTSLVLLIPLLVLSLIMLKSMTLKDLNIKESTNSL